jgi:uncharacterized membrane protein
LYSCLLLIIGLFFKFLPPKKINIIYGWKTRFSRINQDTWNESHRFGSKLFIITAVIDFLVSLIFSSFEVPFFGISIFTILIIGEIHLRKTFDKYGNRKYKVITNDCINKKQ